MDTIPQASTFTEKEANEELIIPDDHRPFFRASIKTEPSENMDSDNSEEMADLEDPYQCFVCGVDCKSQQELISHYEALHADESQFDLRNENGDPADDMDDDPLAGDEAPANIVDGVKHENIEDAFEAREYQLPLNLYLCAVCGFASNGTVEEVNRHMLQHVTVTPISCEGCKYVFSERYRLKNHILGHPQEAPHICVHCPFSCNDLQAMKDHCVTHHLVSASNHTTTNSGKEYGLRVAIIGNPSIKCPERNFVLPAVISSNMAQPPQQVNVANVVSPDYILTIPNDVGREQVGKESDMIKVTKPSITLEEMLKSNAENVPTTRFKKIAPTGSVCVQRPSWKIVPNPKPAVEKSSKQSKTQERGKKHPCPYCTFKARDSYSLKVHVYRHTQEKPFACSLCQYRATQRAHLQKHFGVHIKRGELDFSEVRVSSHPGPYT